MSDEHYTKTAERILGTIEKKNVQPKPAWRFMLEEGVMWGVAGCAFVVGSVATALTAYIVQASFVEERLVAASDLRDLFVMLPFVWLVLIAVGVFYTVHAIQTSERGYLVGSRLLVGGAILMSVCTGYGLHALGVGELIDRHLLVSTPLYKPMSGFYVRHWMSPERGQWVGVVVDRHPPTFTLHTIDGREWTVFTTEETTVHGPKGVETGMRVRVIGSTTDPHMCEAYEIKPFRGRMGVRVQPFAAGTRY